MAGEVVVDGVVVEVEVGGRELSAGRARPARGPAEANLGKRFGWMLNTHLKPEAQDMQIGVLTTRAARATQRARPRVRAKTRATWAAEDLILVPIWGEKHL